MGGRESYLERRQLGLMLMDSLAVVLVAVLSFGLSVGIAGLVLDRIMRVAHRAAVVQQPSKTRRGPAAS
jgi:putative effector of murein hydrolase LrgA (UPF0299 family)